ncbi:MAG: hypothetical protein WBF14_12655 [Candidatus Acidiferrales bacterium]
MNKRNAELAALVGLLVLLVVLLVYYFRPAGAASTPVVAADAPFKPLDVQEPELRLDRLENLRKLVYAGGNRDIFNATPPPPPIAQRAAEEHTRPVGPRVPPPPPPVQFPAQFFGTATMSASGRKLGFFQQGDDVVVVQEGAQLYTNFRLIRINNDSATIQEISSGRQTTVPMVQAPDAAAIGDPSNNGPSSVPNANQ